MSSSKFPISKISLALFSFSVASVSQGAGLDRSSQDTTAFFQDGTYFEAVYSYIDADVTGVDKSGNDIEDIAEDYDFFRYGVKADISDSISVGVLYDEPWGAAADYVGNNNFVAGNDPNATVNYLSKGVFQTAADANAVYTDVKKKIENIETSGGTPPQTLLNQAQQLGGMLGVAAIEAAAAGENTNVEVRTQSVTGLVGVKLGQENEFQIYGGPVAQRLKADLSLRGKGYSSATGYELTINPGMDYGWIAGLKYSKPAIALKAALTYRSEIDHDTKVAEFFPALALRGDTAVQTSDMTVTTPKSLNFDFQTGLNPTTLATAKVRWVPWSDFAITPPLYTTATSGLNVVDYPDDQWVVEVGVGKRLSPALAVSGTVGWDSGAGNPATSLGPIEGYYSVGAGAKVNLNKNWAVSAGAKYLMFGDAEGQLASGAIVSDFEDNDGFVAGIKLSYQDK